ncbi:hypothetical protein IPM62_04845 [Candidatus Woesebacteria bacterium]|nr:MAG: hypothetical protein IPM62_04845 [Candidatus Woesebacteria bacterium]
MIIFYTNSVSTKDQKQEIFDEIIRSIRSHGHKVISPETHKYSDLLDLEKANKKISKISIHNQFIRKAIEMSDAAIFEASKYSFKLGQEAQMSLDKKIPVLCLSDERDYSAKVQDPLFYSKIYSSVSEIDKIVKEFLATVRSNHLNKRINVFLHNKHISYLNWYVKVHDGTNRSEVIRKALEKIIETDRLYKNR